MIFYNYTIWSTPCLLGSIMSRLVYVSIISSLVPHLPPSTPSSPREKNCPHPSALSPVPVHVRFEKAFCRSPVQLFQTLDAPLYRFAHEITQKVRLPYPRHKGQPFERCTS